MTSPRTVAVVAGFLCALPGCDAGESSHATAGTGGAGAGGSASSTIQPVAAQVPVVTGEMGENDCGHGYVDGYMSWADGAGTPTSTATAGRAS